MGLRSWWPWLALALGALLTVAAWHGVRRYDRKRLEAMQSTQADVLADRISRRMQSLIYILKGASSYLAREPHPPREEWRYYVESLGLARTQAGVLGLSFAEWVPRAEIAAHERRMRAEGFPDYQVQPGGADPDPAGSGVITFLEPMDERNQRAFAHDMWADPVRREAMARARDSGNPALSGKLKLYQEGDFDGQAGLVLYAPVYRRGVLLDTVAERRKALLGWATCVLRMGDFIGGLLQEETSRMDIDLYDGAVEDEASKLFDSDVSRFSGKDGLPLRRSLEVGGRTWSIQFQQNPALAPARPGGNRWDFLAGGISITLLLSALLATLAGSEARAMRLADQRGEDLLAAESRFRALFEKAPLGMAMVESLSGRYLAVNRSLSAILGYSPEELLGRSFLGLTHPESLESARIDIQKLESGELAEYSKEKKFIHKNGREILVRIHVVRLPGDPTEAARHLTIMEDVTEAKRRDAELAASEARFRTIVDMSPDPITLSRMEDGQLVVVNPAFCELLGVTMEEALGLPTAQLGIWEDARQRGAMIDTLRKEGTVQNFEVDFHHRDGSLRRVLLAGRILHLETDFALVVGKDLTERYRAEEALRKEQARFRLVSEHAKDLVFVCRLLPEPGFEYVSPSSSAMIGYTPEELYADPTLGMTVVHPEDRPKLQWIMEGKEGPQGPLVIRWIHKDGTVLWSEQILSYHRDGTGRVVAFQGSARDITAVVQARSLLEASEARWKFALEGAGEGVWDWDLAAAKVFFSTRWKEMIGYGEEEISSDLSEWEDRLHPEDREQVFVALERHFAGASGSYQSEFRLRRKDGSYAWILARGMVVAWDAAGKPGRMIGTHQDISGPKRLERELQESLERYSVLAANSSDTIWVMRQDGTFSYHSPAVFNLRGLTPEEANAIPMDQVLTPASLATARRALEEERAKPKAVRWRSRTLELEMYRKDGSTVWTEVSINPVWGKAGGFAGLQGASRDISERKDAEARLVREAQRYSQLMATSQDALHVVDSSGVLREWNPAFLAHLGYSAEEAAGLRVWDWDRQWNEGELREVIPSLIMAPRHFETVHRRKDGTLRVVEIKSSGFMLDGEQLLYAAARDITERTLTEEALRASESRLRILADQLPDSFVYQYVAEPGQMPRFIHISAGVERLCGVSVEEVLRNAGALLWQMDPAQMPEYLEREAASGRDLSAFAMDIRQRRADGEWRWFQVRSMPRPQADGTVIWEGISTDITAQKLGLLALEDSESRLRSVVENAVDAIYVHDLEGRILLSNREACRATGYSREELVRLTIAGLDLDFSEARDALAWRSLVPGQQVQLLGRHRRKDGSTFPVEVHLGLLSREEPRRILAMVRDLTEREQAHEHELRARKAESLVLMAGGIAHDFNNLFQAIMSNLDVAEMRSGGQDSVALPLRQAKGVLRQAVSLSWKMLDFSGRGFVSLEPVELEVWLRQVRATLKLELPATFTLDLECDSVPRVQADPSKLWQVLKAMTDNATEAASPGPGGLHLRLFADFGEDRPGPLSPGVWPVERPPTPATVCLEIADEGPGVPAELLPLICDPFYSTKAPGRGLGLAAAVGILKAHGAGLHVLNGPGKGLLFRIHFPPGGV